MLVNVKHLSCGDMSYSGCYHDLVQHQPPSTYNIIQQPQKRSKEYAAIDLISILMSSLDTDTEF